MSSPTALSRTITTSLIQWRGLLVEVIYERQRHVGHLQVRTLDPNRPALPITAAGYVSSFISKDMIEADGDPAAYVSSWLDDAATAKPWRDREAAIRQYALL